jgi:hypothetical protein
LFGRNQTAEIEQCEQHVRPWPERSMSGEHPDARRGDIARAELTWVGALGGSARAEN